MTLYSFSQSESAFTFAGSGIQGSIDANRTAASFNRPFGLAFNSSGDLFVADYNNYKIRKITPTGDVSTFAGSGTVGFVDGNGVMASFNFVTDLDFDSAGNLFVCDYNNHCIRKITPSGEVTTFAGTNSFGSVDGIGTNARFKYPSAMVIDEWDNIYVTDFDNHKIRKITPAGVVTTIAGGNGFGTTDGSVATAKFKNPFGIEIDLEGNIYVADSFNHTIRKISGGVVTTIAGLGTTSGYLDAIGTNARFNFPYALQLDNNGDLLIADTFNNRIRKMNVTTGAVTTYAGNGVSGSVDDVLLNATFNQPCGIAINADGKIFVSEYLGHKIRKFDVTLSNNSFLFDNSVSIYPNPSSNFVTINTKDLTNVKLSIYDINGRLILEKPLSSINNVVEITSFENGIYIFKIKSEQGNGDKLIIKN